MRMNGVIGAVLIISENLEHSSTLQYVNLSVLKNRVTTNA